MHYIPIRKNGNLYLPDTKTIAVATELFQVSQKYGQEGRFFLRQVSLQDQNRNEGTIKLWGEQADLEVPAVGKYVKVQQVRVEEYRGEKELHSTCLTTITVG